MKHLFLAFSLFAASATQAQVNFMYQSEELKLYSRYLRDTIAIDIQLPQSYFEASEKVSFPLLLLLDQHNINTYLYNIQTVNILTYHAQIPELIAVGIPFDESTRFYFTSHQRIPGDSLTGAQRLEKFLFTELIPYLEEVYLAKGPRIIVGHSRTGYFTSYLMTQRYQDFEAAASFSGFFEELYDEAVVLKFLKNFEQQPKNFKYYFSAGSNLEERVYLMPWRSLRDLLQSQKTHPGFSWHFQETTHANHMGNYNLSLPWALTDYFNEYTATLEEWVYDKGMRYQGKQAFQAFSLDYFGRASKLTRPFLPGLVHIFSLANLYENAGDLVAALDFFAYGAEFFPKNMELQFHTTRLQLGMGKLKEGIATAERAMQWAEQDPNRTDEEKAELKQAFQELLDAVKR